MNILISIIIPAHNCADVLGNAINSITKHIDRSNEIEILIVENGSTDNTTEVAKKFQTEYPYIKILHSSKGVSNARNKGMEEATGEWIVFLDADDKFTENGIDILLRDAKREKADICFFGHMHGNEARLLCNKEDKQVYKGKSLDECKSMMLSNPTRYFTVWAKLIKRTLITDNNIKFNSNLRLAEDGDFLLQCLVKTKCIVIKKDIIYHYIISGASTMRSFDGNKIKDYIISMNESRKIVENESAQVKNAFILYILMHLNIAMVRETYSFNNPESLFKKYKRMCEVIKEPVFRHAIKKTKINQCFSPRMLPILCFKLHVNLGASIIYFIRALQNYLREK